MKIYRKDECYTDINHLKLFWTTLSFLKCYFRSLNFTCYWSNTKSLFIYVICFIVFKVCICLSELISALLYPPKIHRMSTVTVFVKTSSRDKSRTLSLMKVRCSSMIFFKSKIALIIYPASYSANKL